MRGSVLLFLQIAEDRGSGDIVNEVIWKHIGKREQLSSKFGTNAKPFALKKRGDCGYTYERNISEEI